jgi:hypothetical protein
MTDEQRGRDRLAERAKQEDLGERGERDVAGGAPLDQLPADADPIQEARAEELPANTNRDRGDLASGDIPGNTENMERWEREKRMQNR